MVFLLVGRMGWLFLIWALSESSAYGPGCDDNVRKCLPCLIVFLGRLLSAGSSVSMVGKDDASSWSRLRSGVETATSLMSPDPSALARIVLSLSPRRTDGIDRRSSKCMHCESGFLIIPVPDVEARPALPSATVRPRRLANRGQSCGSDTVHG